MAKPVILVVDDDREVLSAVERDLRHHYRQTLSHSRRAVVATGARDAAHELKRRGTPIALFLVDQRMPDMTGTEFLREMRKLHPDAKRTLLTAYADSEAAIAAINEVGLDHYLMKPWDPPEQRLYPVLDDLLADWSARARVSFEGVRVIGSRWSPRATTPAISSRATRFPISGSTSSRTPRCASWRFRPTAATSRACRWCCCTDGTTLTMPSNPELAAKIGLQTAPTRPFYDLAIIGAGPAGLACAVYGASEGLKVILIEQNAPGGQAGTSSMIENYLGFPNGVTGADLARRASTQAKKFGAELLIGHSVVGVKRGGSVQGRAAVERPGGGVSRAAAVLGNGGARAERAGRHAAHWRRRVLRRGAVGGRDLSRPAECSFLVARTRPGRARCSSRDTPHTSR